MTHLFAAVFAVGLVAAFAGSPAFAQTPRDCVAAQMSAMGFSPSADTWTDLKRAAIRYREQAPPDIESELPPFSARAALAWCRILGQKIPDLAQHWPVNADPLIFTDSDAAVAQAALLAGQKRVRKFMQTEYGIVLAGRYAVAAAETDRVLMRMVNKALRNQGKRGGRLNTDVSRFCNDRRVGGFAGRHFIGLCWPPALEGEPRYDHLLRSGLLPVLAHEMMHQAQYELTNDIPSQRMPDGSDFLLGPAWMVEGAAEYLELQFVTGPIAFEGTALFNLQSSARRTQVKLRDLRQSGAVSGGRAYGTARFAAVLLAQKHGGRALFDYFTALGTTLDRDQAFQEVFGQPMAEFEQEFETLRRDFGLAEAYGAK